MLVDNLVAAVGVIICYYHHHRNYASPLFGPNSLKAKFQQDAGYRVSGITYIPNKYFDAGQAEVAANGFRLIVRRAERYINPIIITNELRNTELLHFYPLEPSLT